MEKEISARIARVADYLVEFDGTLDSMKAILHLVNTKKYDVSFRELNDNKEFINVDFIPIIHQLKQEELSFSAYHMRDDNDYIIFHADGSISVNRTSIDEELPEVYKK